MRFIDFFAGIGGFRKGMELAGHKCVGFCEWDKFAVASYTSMHLITEEQRKYLSTLTMKQRQKEILKEEYRNGEWYAKDIRTVSGTDLPQADCWCYGSPCQSFSLAGKRAGLEGSSGLVQEIFRLLDELEEENRPEWLLYENVKGMFSSNQGWDYAAILSEMDRLGYDIEWQNINSKWFVPQNRERIYTIGHLRRYGSRKVLPVEGTGGENCVCQIGSAPNRSLDNPQPGRTYSIYGIAPTLNPMEGGGREPRIVLPCFCDMNYGAGVKLTENARTLQARYYKGVSGHAGETSGVAIKIIGEVNSSQDEQVHDISGISKFHSAGHNNSPKVAIPVLTPDRINKRQNGRRFKENGEPAFTLTAQDRHGVAIGVTGHAPKQDDGIYVEMPGGFLVYAVWYEKYRCYIAIRRLTPKECFRLQGWSDDYFERAAFVNSDSQLYKQAGNGITVPVVAELGKRMM